VPDSVRKADGDVEMLPTSSPAMSAVEPLRRCWRAWKRIGRKIGDIQSRVFLTLFFFTVVAPFALGIRWFADPLALRLDGRGRRPRVPAPGTPLERALRQY